MAKTNKHKDVPSHNTRVAASRSLRTYPKKPRGARNRASRARLFKLSKHLSKDRKDKIQEVGYEGLLDIGCDLLPSELSTWLIRTCFNAESGELVIPGKGRIKVFAASGHHILGLPFPGDDP